MIGYLLAGLTTLIERLFAERIDYYALHPGTVVAQHDDDGTLDIVADARPDGTPSPLTSLSRVPIEFAIPGSTFKLREGARVMIGFRNGDPQGRYALVTSWATVKSFRADAGDKMVWEAKEHVFDEAKGRGAARIGDLVAIGGGVPDPTLAVRGVTCFLQIVAPVPPAVLPTPPAVPFGMIVVAKLQFAPKPYVGAITTSKASHKV